MGVYKSPRASQVDYFRNMERLIEANPHMVYVIQEKRALRNMAHDLGIEFLVGDLKEPKSIEKISEKHGKSLAFMKKQLADGISVESEHTKQKRTANAIALHHLDEKWDYYILLREHVEKSLPALVLNLEKSSGKFFDPNSTENEGRLRLLDPKGLSDFYRKKSKTPGVSYVMGVDKKSGKHLVQAIRFDKKTMPEPKARVWWSDHKGQFTKKWKW